MGETRNGSHNQLILVGAIVALVFIGAATMIAVALGRPDQVGIIIPTLLGLIGPVVLGLLALINSGRSVIIAQKAVETAEKGVVKTELVATRIDGQLDELKTLIRAAAFAEGKAEGKSEQKAESALVLPPDFTPVVETVSIDAETVHVDKKEKK